MSEKSIESLRREQKKLVNIDSDINAQIKALMQKKADNTKEKKRVDKELKKAEKIAVSVEKRKNRNVRTRNLIKLAGDVLNLFPELKNQFEASVTKDEYNRNGEIARREIVAFISSKKEFPILAQEPEKVIESTPPDHDETPSAVSLQAEPKNKDSEIVSKTTPAPSKAPSFDFTVYNEGPYKK